MSQTDVIPEPIRSWYENSPTAQRAYARVRADVEMVIEQARPTVESVLAEVKPKVQELWEQVGPLIDPPAKEKETPPQEGSAKPNA